MYHIIKNIYTSPESCVLVGDRLTGWFQAKSGVHQEDSLSPILFAIFIDDLAEELKCAQTGINIDDDHLALLMYADDVVLIADSHSKAQQGLDIMSHWCTAWGMKVNIKKSQVVHHRNPQRKRHQTPLILCGAEMEYVTDYKYLGCWVNEFDNDAKTVDAYLQARGGHLEG